MKALSPSKVQEVLSLFDSGATFTQIITQTGVSMASVSRLVNQHHPDFKKPPGGRPRKLTERAIKHASCLITSGQVDTAEQAAKIIKDTVQDSFHT